MIDKSIIDASVMDGMPVSMVCGFCKHLFSVTDHTCAAFPNGIPTVIWKGENDHRNPVEGDHGIQFESREPKQNNNRAKSGWPYEPRLKVVQTDGD